MAYFTHKRIKGRRYLYIYTVGQEQVKPRSRYKHLDGAAEHQILAWIAENVTPYEGKKVTPNNILFSDDRLTGLLDQWQAHALAVRGRKPKTVKGYASYLRRYAFPFFVEQGLKDPAQWPGVSIRLFEYLQKYECSQALIAEINNALRSFFRWAQEEGIVAYPGELRLRNSPKKAKQTPLPFILEPETVLQFAREAKVPAVQLMALAGYFFSLRPQETFALRPRDFLAGSEAAFLEACKAAVEVGQFGRLAVNVTRQREPDGNFSEPKAHSKGWVACFSKEAALLLVSLLNDAPEKDRELLSWDNRKTWRVWEEGTKGTELERINLKDLRRGSLYWLGHHTGFAEKPMLLMKHARHKEFDTTLLYLRRPGENPEAPGGKLDLDA